MGKWRRAEKILTYAEHLDFLGSWIWKGFLAVVGGAVSDHYVARFMKFSFIWKVAAWLVFSAILYGLFSLLWKMFAGMGPEIMLAYDGSHGDRDQRLVVLHAGGGSARNIEVREITNGHWAADFAPISFLPVGGRAEAKPTFRPVSPQAIRDQAVGLGRMTLEFFLTTSLEVGPISIMVSHEDGASRFRYETDFDATYRAEDGTPYFSQKARRTRRLARRSPQ